MQKLKINLLIFEKKYSKLHFRKEEFKMLIKNIFLHLKLVTYHRWLVFKLCLRAGVPWRGFLHDLYITGNFKLVLKGEQDYVYE